MAQSLGGKLLSPDRKQTIDTIQITRNEMKMTTTTRRALVLTLALLVLFVTLASAQRRGRRPGNAAGRNYTITVSPGPDDVTLVFSSPDCPSNPCTELEVNPSSEQRFRTVTLNFSFPGERIARTQIAFPGGTPFFMSRRNRRSNRQKFYDDRFGNASGSIRKRLKTIGWAPT
jgi:hypothetical protein